MRTLFFVLSLILIASAITSDAKAINEYLNDYPTHCSKGSWELYTEVDRYDYDQRMNSSSDYFADSGKVGIRFRKEFGSTCTDPYDTVDASKITANIITGQSALGATPADTDELLISDAGTLKRVDYSHLKSSVVNRPNVNPC